MPILCEADPPARSGSAADTHHLALCCVGSGPRRPLVEGARGLHATGLNTGGMGTFSPSPFYTKEVEEFCEKYVYQATVDAMAAEGWEII